MVGAILILGLRFITYGPEKVHYHANFSVYVNGQKEQFQDMRYYEETEATACTLEKVESPSERAHMHGNINSVVHVEDHLVTWGNFFQNLGWGLGADYLKTADKIYTPDSKIKLTFILNGKKVDDIAKVIINSEDRLLVYYGAPSTELINKLYTSVPGTAGKYNVERDPAGCSGNTQVKITDRLKHLF